MKCAERGTHQPINYDNQSVGYRMRESSQIMHFFVGSLHPRNRETPPRCTVARPGGLSQAKCAIKQLHYLRRGQW